MCVYIYIYIYIYIYMYNHCKAGLAQSTSEAAECNRSILWRTLNSVERQRERHTRIDI